MKRDRIMTSKPRPWRKRIIITALVLLGAITVAIAALPDLRQGLALLWAYNANTFASDEWRAARSSDTIPFRHDRHVLVPATAQGERAVSIALDTGSPMTALISGPHLQGLTFKTGRTVPIGGPGRGNSAQAQVITELDLEVGSVAFFDLTGLLIPWEQMGEFFASPEQVYVHGILGYDLFSRYVVEIDFERELLTLHQPDDFDYRGNGEVLPLTYVQRKPYVEAEVTQLDGTTVPVNLHLDLGKPTALSLIPSAEAKISLPPNAVSSESRGLSGRVDERMSRVRTLRLGEQKLRNVVTTFPIDGFSTTGARNGVVGVEVLTRFRVFLDYPRDRMILEPIAIDRPFEDDMSGITWAPQSGRFAIRRILPKSPAEIAGLQAGDELVLIDALDASNIRFGELVERLRAGDGTEVALQLLRGTEVVSVVLTLHRRI